MSQKAFQDDQGSLLIQGLVAGTTFGGMDARRTAFFTLAAFYVIKGRLKQIKNDIKPTLGKADPSRLPVIDKDGALSHLGMKWVADPADIVPVTECKKGKHADGSMLDGVDATHEMKAFRLNIREFRPIF